MKLPSSPRAVKRDGYRTRIRAASAGNGKAGTEVRSGKSFLGYLTYHGNPEKPETRCEAYLRSFNFFVTA